MNKLLWLGLAAALGMSAVETRAWRQTDFADFEKGSLKRLSLRSDGRLTLAPAVKELLDPSVGYLWACAEDSKGNVYAGGGSTTGTSARLYKIDPRGTSSTVGELEGMEIHAIAIDSKDGVYAATAPDGKVYRIRNGGKPEVFFDPKAKYIWALVFGANDDLFIGTGDKGEIWRVTANGQGAVFFKTDETHARSLAVDGQGNVIAGTEPSGLILRISPSGQGFVLHQTAKREITSVAVSRSGVIYAAGIGSRAASSAATPLPAPAPPPPVAPTPAGAVAVRPTTPPFNAAPSVTGGSDIYRIDSDGFAQRVWTHPTEVAYSIALDAEDRPVIATGNRGGVYRLEPAQRYSMLVNLAPTQITQLVTSKSSGAMFAVTGNIGRVYKIGPGVESDGVFESDLFDTGGFTYWGRYGWEGHENGGRIQLETRTGNLNDAHKNWSAWAAAAPTDNRIQSPPARFLQYRLTLHAASGGAGPEVDTVDVKYQSKNIAPVIEQVEITPANYKFPIPSAAPPPSSSSSPATLSLPAIGQKRGRSGGSSTTDAGTSAILTYAKGFAGARWAANDENGDTLIFKVEIRGMKETEWKLLRDKLRDRYYSWDSSAFADGEYVVRVTASDALSNTPQQSLTAMLESEPFLIDNGAPEIHALAATAASTKLNVTFRATDALSNIVKAEYSLSGGDWIVAEPTTRLSDAKQLTYNFSVDRVGTGEYTLAVRVTDEFDNQAVAKATGR